MKKSRAEEPARSRMVWWVRLLLGLILSLLSCGPSTAPRDEVPAKKYQPAARQAAERPSSAIKSPIPDDECRAIQGTLRRIDQGERRYRQDGVVFQNREKRLPLQPQGYYREYTVETPGAGNRGARRIVRGRAAETYYTRDHYKTFFRIQLEDYNGGSCSLKVLPE